MSEQKKEKRILMISFIAGLLFAVSEFVFAIYSRSQSALMDAAYDASELVFIVLILFLTPLFYKPISEKRPYGFSQVESIFLIIKGFMMLSVTASISATIIESILAGGKPVDGGQISIFQLCLGMVSIVIFFVLRKLNRSIVSPIVDAELLGWRMDIVYSLGMSTVFFASGFLEKTPLAVINPYLDQVVAIVVALFMLPEIIKMLWSTIKDVFLFAPSQDIVDEVKELCQDTLEGHHYQAYFYDIIRTGRHLWVDIYFSTSEEVINIEQFQDITLQLNEKLGEKFQNCICQLVLSPKEVVT